MNIRLKQKYRTYTESTQYSNGRRHNGNGRREGAFLRQNPIVSPQLGAPRVRVIDGLTGKSRMVVA